MHLKQLKLAGFKSFVDPTIVHFPSQLVAVVGPNGCGKSNIIDAVRWVMGEGVARNLRGESMTDVIFNGSSNRKAVGRASVELIFDNSLGRLTGAFASYEEISVKRVITRDGDSSYYMNGCSCRRKDITNIFLGTGAGARGYSIIRQGTISQLVEAKPEDLRIFLEEAAGVSKYRERRKETLQRIGHTRDNLIRVTDIRDELDKQLQRLERQAKIAESYLILKEQEQACRAEILALKWHDLVTQQKLKQSELSNLVQACEQQQSFLVSANTKRIILVEQLQDKEEQSQQIQTTFYQLGTAIARLEESIQQQIREKKRLEQEQQQIQEDSQIVQEQLKQNLEEVLNCQHNARYLEEQLVQLKNQFEGQEKDLQDVQKQQAQSDLRWQEVQMQVSHFNKELQVAHIHAKHLEQKQQQTLIRLEKLKLEQECISIQDLQETKHVLEAERIHLESEQQCKELELKQSQEQTNQLRMSTQELDQKLFAVQDDFHRVNSECAALMAIQHAARQSGQNRTHDIEEWSSKPRLMDVLDVEARWQLACETVLHDSLHAYVLESLAELWPQKEACALQEARVVTLRSKMRQLVNRPCLADKVQGDIPAYAHSLEHVFAAEHWDEALSWLPDLLDHQSIITPEGLWLGQGWVKFVRRNEQDELGLLSRQQKIAELRLAVDKLQQELNTIRVQRDENYQRLQQSITDCELKQTNVNACNEALRTNNAAFITNEQAIVHAQQLAATWAAECDELHLMREQTTKELLMIQDQLFHLEQQCQAYELQQEQCMWEKKQGLDALALRNKQVEETRRAVHQAELIYDREKNKIRQLEERSQQKQEHMNDLQARLKDLTLQSAQMEKPVSELKVQLDQQLLTHTEMESQWSMSREQITQLRLELEELEKNNLVYDLEVKRIQELMAQIRMQEQAFLVRASSVQESLDELGFQAQDLLSCIPEGITQDQREEELHLILEKIKRLGAINLAAIEEFSDEQQRKFYLDKQHHDLNEALSILEMAIEKMDKETRSRLENTFEELNTSFKALFPRLFGGGKAQLELTCEDLLEAGIVVMAQPPGKRNSTIHLLSGGEKAMTAVALVFAMFQLNPSPFCMLDEVDAPLDDVNVGRFCDLVQEMSQFVQFIFITHNKVTMELADHLMGVTMREPGVSRLVAVDVTQALAME
jgi:chromosome segregation protein